MTPTTDPVKYDRFRKQVEEVVQASFGVPINDIDQDLIDSEFEKDHDANQCLEAISKYYDFTSYPNDEHNHQPEEYSE